VGQRSMGSSLNTFSTRMPAANGRCVRLAPCTRYARARASGTGRTQVGGFPYAIRLISGKTVLPPGGVAWRFAQWSDAGEKIQRFIERSVGRSLRDGERIPLELALIHRPNNDYNPNAVSISALASFRRFRHAEGGRSWLP